jgi:hypothetical protein
MHELVAVVIFSMQNKMHMSIHQAKRKDNHLMLLAYDKNPVHSVDEIVFIMKQCVNRITVGIKVPTISDGINPPLDKGCIERKVRLNLSEQVIIYLHHHFPRLLWPLTNKYMYFFVPTAYQSCTLSEIFTFL